MGAGEYDLVCSVKDTLGFISSTAKCGGPGLHFQCWEVEDQKFKSILCTQHKDRLDSMNLSQKMKMNNGRRQHLPFTKEKSNRKGERKGIRISVVKQDTGEPPKS